jgi:hypothetical protein
LNVTEEAVGEEEATEAGEEATEEGEEVLGATVEGLEVTVEVTVEVDMEEAGMAEVTAVLATIILGTDTVGGLTGSVIHFTRTQG